MCSPSSGIPSIRRAKRAPRRKARGFARIRSAFAYGDNRESRFSPVPNRLMFAHARSWGYDAPCRAFVREQSEAIHGLQWRTRACDETNQPISYNASSGGLYWTVGPHTGSDADRRTWSRLPQTWALCALSHRRFAIMVHVPRNALHARCLRQERSPNQSMPHPPKAAHHDL